MSAGSRIFGNLQGGRTLKKGVETGKIFTPERLNSFRKRNGLTRVIYQPPAAEKNPSLVALTADAEAEGSGALGANAQKSMGETAAQAAQAAYLRSAEGAAEKAAAKGSSGSGSTNPEKMAAVVNIIDKVAGALGLDPALVKAVVKTESNFNHKAVSKAGAKGLMQLMPKTAKEMGVEDPFNAFENIWGGARYLKKMLDRHGGNLNKALAAYNWGPGNLDRHGDGSLPGETRRYIEAVNRNYVRFKKESQMA
jgi:soluble lytic murein transglycosylase-like protein